MLSEREGHGLIKFEDKVYAFGGRKDIINGEIDSAEMYDIVQNTWQFIQPLPKAADAISCARLKDKIYITNYLLPNFTKYFSDQ